MDIFGYICLFSKRKQANVILTVDTLLSAIMPINRYKMTYVSVL